MNMPLTAAHLCGSLGQALVVLDDETWLYEAGSRRRPTTNDIHFFFEHGLEVRSLDVSADGGLTEEKLQSALEKETRCFCALHGLLVGMDSDLERSLRLRGIRRSDSLLGGDAVADFAEPRFLRPISSQAWDLVGARDLAASEKLSLAERLYAIVDGPFLLQLENEIAGWASDQAYTSVERAEEIEKAYDTGLVAAIATALHDGAATKLHARILLARDVEWNRRLAVRLVNRFGPMGHQKRPFIDGADETQEQALESNESDVVAKVRSRIRNLLDQYNSRRRREGHRYRDSVSGVDVFAATLNQVEWIAKRFEAGRVEAAWRSVIELAERQLEQSDPKKLAMSMTNLASRLGRYETVASVLLDLAAMLAPDDPAIPSAFAELFRSWGRPAEALSIYDRTIENFPRNTVVRNGRAETLRALGRLEEALAAYDRTIEDFPQNAVAHNGRAETLRARGHLEEALAAYDRIIEDFPQDAFARNGRAETLRALGRLEEALAAYDRTIEDFPQNAVARNGRAETLRAQGHLEEALAAYDRTIEDFPQNAVARNGRAETLRALGRLEEALAAYDRIIEDFPQNAFARSGRAETLRALGRLEEALAAYDRTIEDFPQNAVACNGRAETLRALGRLGEALAAYDRTIEDFPQDVVARSGRAETLRARGHLEEALAAYDLIIEDFPQNAFARNGSAETLRALGHLEEALAAYDRTIEDFRQDVVARSGRAEALRALGRLEEALAAYDRIVEDFPQDAFARTGRAETLRAQGRFEEALVAYDRTIEDFPQNAFARSGRAETLRAQGRLEEALAAYDHMIKLFPHDGFARNGRAVVLIDLGKTTEARAVLKVPAQRPRVSTDWVAAHILCMLDLKTEATPALEERLTQYVATCPFYERRLYFEATLAVARIALKRSREARLSLMQLPMRLELDVDERAALKLIEAHAEAVDGDLEAARRSLTVAANIIPYELFRWHRLRREVERRCGIGLAAPPVGAQEIAASDNLLVRLETEFLMEYSTKANRSRRLAA